MRAYSNRLMTRLGRTLLAALFLASALLACNYLTQRGVWYLVRVMTFLAGK